MNNRELSRLAHSDDIVSKYFRGVFASDELMGQEWNLPCCFIANTDTRDQSGSHWTAFYLPVSGPLEYFCSYGLSPFAFITYLQQSGFSHITRNTDMLQSLDSVVCGQYCLYYLHQRCRGLTMDDALNAFGENRAKNDHWVNGWVERHYDIDLDVHNANFMHKQIARVMRATVH